MMTLSDSPQRPIFLYENERMWIGRGFSKTGLLPTERGPFSNEDGSLSWKTVREACLALLLRDPNKKTTSTGIRRSLTEDKKIVVRRGWSYHKTGGDDVDIGSDEDFECRSGNESYSDEYCGFLLCNGAEDGPTDEEGWSYFPDFSPLSLCSPTRNRGMLDFVRRRKLRRIAYFRPDHFLPEEINAKCDFCDSKAVLMLSNVMLEALSLASLFLTGTSNDCTDAKVLPLKAKLIDFLQIGRNCAHDVLLYEQNNHYDTMSDIYKIKDRLSSFAESAVGSPGGLIHLIQPDLSDNLLKAMPKRKTLLSERYFDEGERLALAKLLVKDVDRYAYHLHCPNKSCSCVESKRNVDVDQSELDIEVKPSSTCDFRMVSCSNSNCPAKFSFKYQVYHDEECGFKLVPCPNGCGMEVPRNWTIIHVREKCALRSAECPLASLGCTAVVQAQDVNRHIQDGSEQHFLLIVNRMLEYQAMIKKLSARIQLLEENNAKLELEVKGRAAQVSSKKDTDILSNEMKKLSTRLGTLEVTCRTEFKKIEHDKKTRK